MNRAVVIFASAVGITWCVTTAAVLGSLATAVMTNDDSLRSKEEVSGLLFGIRIKEVSQKVGGGEHPPSSDDPITKRQADDNPAIPGVSPRPPAI
jgi:hypothetical protein